MRTDTGSEVSEFFRNINSAVLNISVGRILMKKFLEFLMKKIQDNMKKMIAQNMASLEGGGRERAI